MAGVYKSLTDFLPMLEEDKIGDWVIDRVNDGTPEHPIRMPFVDYSRLVREVEDAIYDFGQNHPEYGLNRYSSILIATLRSIEKEYGSLDAFVISAPAHEIVKTLADYKSKYKLRNMGEALCWEYLRNVGIDGAKPDVHLRRFLGSERMGKDNHVIATVPEVIDTVRRLPKESGLSMAAIDNIVWSFCSEQYGEICGASPKCGECPVREHCHKNKQPGRKGE